MTEVKIKKAKGTKKYAIKGELEFENYKNCLQATQLKNEINHPGKKMKFTQISLKKS